MCAHLSSVHPFGCAFQGKCGYPFLGGPAEVSRGSRKASSSLRKMDHLVWLRLFSLPRCVCGLALCWSGLPPHGRGRGRALLEIDSVVHVAVSHEAQRPDPHIQNPNFMQRALHHGNLACLQQLIPRQDVKKDRLQRLGDVAPGRQTEELPRIFPWAGQY